ncbi:hypothetical protein R3I94_017854 [Phoxinus phoxinus]
MGHLLVRLETTPSKPHAISSLA